MRILGIVAVSLVGLSLGGCSQLSGLFKKKPHYHTNDGAAVYSHVGTSLRGTPAQTYDFAASRADYGGFDNGAPFVDDFEYSGGTEYIYASDNAAQSRYAGYQIEFFNFQGSSRAALADPRQTEFVKLNGESNAQDWKTCEILNRGYLWASEYDFSLNPDFEVCMRNKGYVLSTEYGRSSKPTLTAQSASR